MGLNLRTLPIHSKLLLTDTPLLPSSSSDWAMGVFILIFLNGRRGEELFLNQISASNFLGKKVAKLIKKFLISVRTPLFSAECIECEDHWPA